MTSSLLGDAALGVDGIRYSCAPSIGFLDGGGATVAAVAWAHRLPDRAIWAVAAWAGSGMGQATASANRRAWRRHG